MQIGKSRGINPIKLTKNRKPVKLSRHSGLRREANTKGDRMRLTWKRKSYGDSKSSLSMKRTSSHRSSVVSTDKISKTSSVHEVRLEPRIRL